MTALPSSPDRIVRGGALAAILMLAATLLSLGLYLYRPSEAQASSARAAALTYELDVTTADPVR